MAIIKLKPAVTETRLDVWRRHLEAAHGVISHAAKAAGISIQHGVRLTKKYDFNAWAADLRLKAGGRKRGRQWGIVESRSSAKTEK